MYPNTRVNSTYRRFFKQCNLRFGAPRSDTCRVCDQNYVRLILARRSKREKIEYETKIHHFKADAAYKSLAADSEKTNCITICVDLQQVLFTPTLTHSDMFYSRQYSTYNFAVHNVSQNQNIANMYLWHESIAKRGAKEIGSCILKFITENMTPLPSNEDRKLIVWSDRCTGQNNNWLMINSVDILLKYTKNFWSPVTVFCPVTVILLLSKGPRKKEKLLFRKILSILLTIQRKGETHFQLLKCSRQILKI